MPQVDIRSNKTIELTSYLEAPFSLGVKDSAAISEDSIA